MCGNEAMTVEQAAREMNRAASSWSNQQQLLRIAFETFKKARKNYTEALYREEQDSRAVFGEDWKILEAAP